jgi:hypothetical protein
LSKVDLLTIYPDQTHDIKRVEVKGNKLKVKGYNPKLIGGRSVFPERRGKISRITSLKRRKRLVVWLFGCDKCYTISEDAGQINENWNTEEAANFINKVIAWAAAKAKIWSNFQVYLLFGAIAFNLILTFLIFRRIGI